MATTEFFLVLIEQLPAIKAMEYPEESVMRELYRSIEGRVLLRLDIKIGGKPLSVVRTERINQGIAFNSVVLTNGKLIWHWQVRFDHTGEMSQSRVVMENEDLIQVHDRHLPVVVKDGIQRMAMVQVFAARDEWDNQLAWGKLHRVKRLIGAV
jgi:hypothetical protein